jgi:DNA-binding LytR/AlgR family response regulator
MNVLIIEDETLLAKELQATISEVDEELKVVDTLPSLKVSRKWFLNNPEPDIIFMDVQLSDGISFTLFDEFQLKCPVVFTTAYDHYALRAFKVNSVDYLLKPIMREDLKRAIDKCKVLLQNKISYPVDLKTIIQNIAQAKPQSQYKEKFIVQLRHQWMPIKTSDIACFYRDNLNYLVTFSGEKYILNFETMDEIEEVLDPEQFYRANRQFIIHADSVHSIMPRENSKLTVYLKPPLKLEVDISRDKAPEFRKWLDR